MKTLQEMNAMQKRLDGDRNALPDIRDHVAQLQHQFGSSDEQIALFTGAADRLIALNEYRGMGIGWTKSKPKGNEEFKQLRAAEQHDRTTVISTLSEVIAHAKDTEHPDADTIATHLGSFESIPQQQDELYQARREYAEQITSATKAKIPYSANQIVDFARSGGQSYGLYEEYVSDDSFMRPVASEELEVAQSAVMGAHFGTGTCHEHSSYAFTEAMMTMPGTRVTMVNVPPEHGLLIIGPPNFPESAHVDTWPRYPSVTSPETYGIHDIQEGFVVVEAEADGRDLRAEAQQHLEPLPTRPAPVPSITLTEAANHIRGLEGIDGLMHYITHTTDHRDYSQEQPLQGGLTLSREAFTATLANNFVVDSPSGPLSSAPSQLQIASAVAAYAPSGARGRGASYAQDPAAGQPYVPGRGGGVGGPSHSGPSQAKRGRR